MGAPTAFGRQAWEGGLGVTGLITFLAAEGWAVSKLQGTSRCVFIMQVFRACPGRSGWVGVGVEPQPTQPALAPPGARGLSAYGQHVRHGFRK